MAIQTSAGTTIGVSTTLPTTFDGDAITGYPSLTLVTIGEVVDIPAFGSTRAVINHSPLATLDVQKFLGSRDNGSLTITAALDDSDTAQGTLRAAVDSGAELAFGVTLPDGAKKFRTGRVSSFQDSVGTIDGALVQATIQIEFTRPTFTVAAA